MSTLHLFRTVLSPIRTLAFAAAALLAVGCSSAESEDVDEGGQAATEAEPGEEPGAASHVYMLRPWTHEEDEAINDGLKLDGLGGVLAPHLKPKEYFVDTQIGGEHIGIECSWDIQVGGHLCSMFFPYRTEQALSLPEGGKGRVDLEGPVVFSGAVAKKIYDNMRGLDRVRTAGPLSCEAADGTARCTMAPKVGGKREYDATSLEYYVKERHVSEAAIDAVEALAK